MNPSNYSSGRKRSRADSGANSLDNTRSLDYNSANYQSELEILFRCYMNNANEGPDPRDVEFSKHLLQHRTQRPPNDSLFEYENAYKTLRDRSETFLTHHFHYLLMPCADILLLRGQRNLEHVTDSIDESWSQADRLHKPTPQPDHSRCLSSSAFTEEERLKLCVRQPGSLSYAVRTNLYFPYLTCEIKRKAYLHNADNQNMHSMSIAIRSLVQLAVAAEKPEKVHRRILGYSISHDLDSVKIYGHYPEVEEGIAKCYRHELAHFNVWTEGNHWKCYSFVEALDSEFVPRHIALVKELLAEIELPRPLGFPPITGSRSGSQYTPSDSGVPASSTNDPQMDPATKRLVDSLEQSMREAKDEAARAREEAKIHEDRLLQELQAANERENNTQRLLQTLTQQMGQLLNKSGETDKRDSKHASE